MCKKEKKMLKMYRYIKKSFFWFVHTLLNVYKLLLLKNLPSISAAVVFFIFLFRSSECKFEK